MSDAELDAVLRRWREHIDKIVDAFCTPQYVARKLQEVKAAVERAESKSGQDPA